MPLHILSPINNLCCCLQEKQSLQEEVAKLELLVQAQQDKLVCSHRLLGSQWS
jgi:hypothetical protein